MSTSGSTSASRRFVLQTVLGEGSFGAVYLAEMEGAGGFKRRVALKLLHPNWDPESDAGRRLRDEARLLGRLDHRHIVRVDDLLRLDGRWALVMEYVPGADLEAVFQARLANAEDLPVAAVLEIGAAVASAMRAAWNAPGDDGRALQVVHRDIKPSNIRLAENGDVKVLDFGVARADFAGRESKTERVRYGSVGYMAPERMLAGAETQAGDVYGLAVVMVELLTLSTYGRAELGMDAQVAQVDRAMARLAARGVGEEAVALLRRALAYQPEDRPAVEEVEAECRRLARAAEGEDLASFARTCIPSLRGAADESVRGRVMAESPSVGIPEVNGGTLVLPEAPAARAPVWIAGAAAVVAAVVVAGIGAFVLAPGESPAPSPPPVAAAALAPPSPAPVIEPPPPAPDIEAPPVAAESPPPPAPASLSRRAPSPAPEAVPPLPPASTGPRLRSAKFSLAGAEGLSVDCGGVAGTGQTSVLLRDLPAGACVVTAGGARATVTVDAPRGVDCTLSGDTLTCR